MSYDSNNSVFSSLAAFYRSSTPGNGPSRQRIVHCINPFSTPSGSEHDKAQRITQKTMERARLVANVVSPCLEIQFAKVTLADDAPDLVIDFDIHEHLTRSADDLGPFNVPRPLPIIADVLNAAPLAPDDIFVFTNVDIALTSNFYTFVADSFARGADCTVINRRSISEVYESEDDLALMEAEVGTKHPGFDCFAFRGSLRDQIIGYDSFVGIGGVMLPLLHQLLSIAEAPVVLQDAHVTFHLGDDKAWQSERFQDYAVHNSRETQRIFTALLENDFQRERFLSRLQSTDKPWVFPRKLRDLAGLPKAQVTARNAGLIATIKSVLTKR